jgi:AcrR family transcriptional regulator
MSSRATETTGITTRAVRKGRAKRLGEDQDADFEQRRLMVLRAASREFLKNGIAGTSIDDIANHLNVTKPTIYHYGRSKDDLVRECLKVGSEQLSATLDAFGASDASGLQKLKELFRHYTANVAEDFGRLLVTIHPRALSAAGRAEYAQARQRFIDVVKDLIRDGIRDGSLRPCNIHLAALTVIGAFNFIGHWYRAGSEYNTDQVFEGLITVLLYGIANPERPRHPREDMP